LEVGSWKLEARSSKEELGTEFKICENLRNNLWQFVDKYRKQ